MSTLEKAIERIRNIEQSVPVNKLQYGSLCVWPLIRINLWFLLTRDAPELVDSSHSDEGKTVSTSNQRWKHLIREGTSTLKHRAGPYLRDIVSNARRINWSHSGNRAEEEIDLLFFSEDDYHTTLSQAYYHRHLDPLIELALNKYSVRKVEIFARNSSHLLPRTHKTEFLIPLSAWGSLLLRSFTPGNNPLSNVRHLEQFRSTLHKQSPNISSSFPWWKVKFQLTRLASLCSFYKRFLSGCSPDAVFFVCYYQENMRKMAMVLACKQLGIPTVDVQHGKQGKYQGAYTHWTQVPEGGYDLLPDYFWSWGEESRENIVRWFPDGVETHQPVIGGNRWLAKWKQDPSLTEGTGVKDYLEKHQQYEKHILISLQPFLDTLPEHLLHAMKDGSDDWFWMLRLHPGQKEEVPDYNELCRTHNIQNVEIDQATDLPLYALLKHTDHHITAYSSVCYEALVFDVPTTIIHEIGESLYTDYINKQHFLLALNKTDLLQSIRNGRERSNLTEENPYIEIRDEAAETALSQILNDGSSISTE